MAAESPFSAAQRRALDLCLRAWPVVHTECDAAVFGPGRAGGGSGGGHESDPTCSAATTGTVDRTKGPAAWMAEWGDWLLDLHRLQASAGPRVLSWSPTAVSVWAWPTLRPVVAQVEQAGTARSRRDAGAVLLARLGRLADRASLYAPRAPSRGQMVGGVTVGERTNTTERCVECGDPILCTAEDPVKRLDGQPLHLRARPGVDSRSACYWLAWRRRRDAAGARAVAS